MKIVQAIYGVVEGKDMTGMVVTDLVREGYSFSNRNLGYDPYPKQKKYLYITYVDDMGKMKATFVSENETVVLK